MTYLKLSIVLGFVLFTAACAKVTVGMGGGGGKEGLNTNAVEKAAGIYCNSANGETLDEPSNIGDPLFAEFYEKAPLFAFTGETDDNGCLKNNSPDGQWSKSWTNEFGVQVWFSINPIDNCIPGGSIWAVTQSRTSNNGQYYDLVNVLDTQKRIMNMNAHQAIRLSVAKERVGLRLLKCTK